MKAKSVSSAWLTRVTAIWGLLVAVIFCLTELGGYTGKNIVLLNWFPRSENRIQDFIANVKSAPPIDPRIVFLAIDEASQVQSELWDDEKEAHPALPLLRNRLESTSRSVWAHAIRRLAPAGAKVITFDLMFHVPGKDTPDLAGALVEFPKQVVIGAHLAETGGTTRSLVPPIQELIPGEAIHDPRVGIVSVFPSLVDNVVRDVWYQIPEDELEKSFSKDVRYSLAARTLQQAGFADSIRKIHGRVNCAFAFRGQTTRVPDDGKTRPGQQKNVSQFKFASLYEIFVPSLWEANFQSGKFFEGKIVVIGPEGNYSKDTVTTPYGSQAGVEMHLNAINAALTGSFLKGIPLWLGGGFILAGAFLSWVFGRAIKNPLIRLCFFVAVAFGWFGVALFANGHGTIIPVFGPSLSFLGSGFGFSLYEQWRDQREQKRTRKTLERYVSRDVVREVLDNPDSFLSALDGMKRPMTILFSDVRGFTTLTESADAKLLVKQLNEYFDSMVSIVFKNNGTLDKFIGDAVMAHWGSITTQSKKIDACNAVRTAVQMRDTLPLLNRDWVKRGMMELQFGIGVNHGEAVVGNLGSRELKMEVSVIGDPVNLASRLEGVTKTYHTDLVIGESVEELVKDEFILRPLDYIVVKGKTQHVEIFGVVGEVANTEIPAWLPIHTNALRAYRAGRFAEAKELWENVLTLAPEDPISPVFIARCEEFLTTPPEDPWTGVYAMKSK